MENKNPRRQGHYNKYRRRNSVGKRQPSNHKKTLENFQELGTKNPNEVIFTVKSSESGFEDFLNSTNFKEDHSLLALQLLSLCCDSDHKENLRNFLKDILTRCSHFLNGNLLQFLLNLLNTPLNSKYENAFVHILNIAETLQTLHPEESLLAVQFLVPTLNDLLKHWKLTLGEENHLKKRVEDLTLKKDQINSQFTVVLGSKTASEDIVPNNFREIPIFPDTRELLTRKRPFLRENVIEGRYLHVDQYLDIQYRLLREDFVRPLREGIASYLDLERTGSRKRVQDIKVYHNVFIKTALVSNEGVLYQLNLNFNQNRLGHFNWETSKRLIYGNLVCLTFDNFATMFFGTVANRDAHKIRHGDIDIKFENPNEILRHRWKTFTMVETDAYFEASRYVLVALQHIRENTFPLKEHIVELRKEISAPEYLSNRTTYCLSCFNETSTTPLLDVNGDTKQILGTGIDLEPVFGTLKSVIKEHCYNLRNDINPENPPKIVNNSLQPTEATYTQSCTCESDSNMKVTALDETTWPKPEDIKLDFSQHKALKLALTKKLAIIQGPPGTGKTYVGLKIMEVLLHNQSVWKGPTEETSPILVLCYTNHALDQFLEGVLKLTKKIVRLGGRSNNEAIQPYCMSNLRRANFSKFRERNYMNGYYREMKRELEAALKQMIEKDQQLKRSGNIILSEEAMKPVIDEAQYEGLSKKAPAYLNLSERDVGNVLPYWLGIRLPPHLLNYHDQCEEQAWIVDSTGTPVKSVVKTKDRKPMSQSYTHVHFITNKDLSETKPFKEPLTNTEGPCVTPLAGGQASRAESKSTLTHVPPSEKEIIDALKLNEQFAADEVDFIVAQRQETNDNGDVTVVDLDEDEVEDDVAAEEYFNNLDNGGFQYQGGKKKERKLIAQKLKEYKLLSKAEIEDFNNKEIWSLRIEDRWRRYKTWHYYFNIHVRNELEELRKEYERKLEAFREIRTEEEILIARPALVIGMTTSGAAKYRQFVQNLRSKIVIVEEAAEVLEAQIVTSLSRYTQHLILIGDHQQLRPNPVVYDLVLRYHLDVSLFERLITNGLPYVSLSIQHRMRPCISKLLVPNIYANLHDHHSVLDYEEVKGVKKSMFFLNHGHLENKQIESTSRVNLHEAEFIVALCQYLLNQQYEAEQITILTTYQGQLYAIKSLMPPALAKVRATVVDNYQGEENDLILLSFVRSNDGGVIGFLKTANRVCVALSRAKKGLYCIGNFDLLADNSPLWKNIVSDLKRSSAIGAQLELVCQLHRNATLVSTAAQIKSIPDGGCQEPCNFRLECDHLCTKKCHPLDPDHKLYQCQQRCAKKSCELNHWCKKLCFQECGKCLDEVYKVIEHCGHEVVVPCYMKDTELRCSRPCSMHTECGHPCSSTCGEPCAECNLKLRKTLPCGHEVIVRCCDRNDEFLCESRCDKPLVCGHQCKRNCGQPCSSCLYKPTILGPCGHQVRVLCSLRNDLPAIRNACEEKCQLLLPCMHPCKGICGRPCQAFCEETVMAVMGCGHLNSEICHAAKNTNDLEKEANCPVKCQAILDCGHVCIGSCGDCFQGRLHVPCRMKCEKTLLCGHSCQAPCSMSCPPCRNVCENGCVHTRCQQMCGFPCIPCFEQSQTTCCHVSYQPLCHFAENAPCQNPCSRVLPCSHKCTGVCGENCPSLCRFCHYQFVADVDPYARFIQLEDCCHIFEVQELSIFLAQRESSVVQCYYCPCCFTSIRRSSFFQAKVKRALRNIEKVKIKCFSIYHENVRVQVELQARIIELSFGATRVRNLVKEPISFMLSFLKGGYLNEYMLVMFHNYLEIIKGLLTLETKIDALKPESSDSLSSYVERIWKYVENLVRVVCVRMMDKSFYGSPQVYQDTIREISRLENAVQVVFGLVITPVDVELKTLLFDTLEVSLHSKPYDLQMQQYLTSTLTKLGEKCSLSSYVPLAAAIIQLREAKGFAIGSWFTCRNDHVNFVPASQQSNDSVSCAECMENIEAVFLGF